MEEEDSDTDTLHMEEEDEEDSKLQPGARVTGGDQTLYISFSGNLLLI